MYKPTAAEKKEQARYQAEDDMRTLSRAAEIQKDKARMGAITKVATAQIKALQSVVVKSTTTRKTAVFKK